MILKKMRKRDKIVVLIAALIAVISLTVVVIDSITNLNPFSLLRIIVSSIYILFLPGYLLSHLLFNKNAVTESAQKEIDEVERIALSFTLSIAIVPLLIFYANLIGIPINPLTSLLVITGGNLLIVLLLLAKKSRQNKRNVVFKTKNIT
jgi:uncharacterized membrane protein